MREIIDHIVPGKAACNKITVLDERGPGGGNHHYDICGLGAAAGSQIAFQLAELKFQKGGIQESGVNGIQNEDLIAIVIDRLRGFQDGPFKCRENAIALTKLEEALMWLSKRTQQRIARNVEGTQTP